MVQIHFLLLTRNARDRNCCFCILASMSDTKFFAYENESIDNCDFEVNIDHELIAIIKINWFLYDKTEKLYANGK